MALKQGFLSLVFFFVGCLVAISLQVYFLSPLSSPRVLYLPLKSLSRPPNNRLQDVEKVGEGNLKKPEDISLDKEGILYVASRDGWIKRLLKNGTLEDWRWINSSTLLGITTTTMGDLIVCDTQEGLLKVNEVGVTNILSHVNGSKLSFADDVIEGKDGSLYFSIASTKFGLSNWYFDVLEARPHGKLLKYHPQTMGITLVLDNLSFANGVALSKHQDYLLVCETWKFRCLKYWLEGDRAGKTEIFIENLPGGPDNINLAPDGSFWIALIQVTKRGSEFVHKSKMVKHLVATFPTMLKFVQGTHKKAMVIKVSEKGEILEKFEDPNGKVMSFVTSAVEYDGYLYLGSLNTNFIGKLPLHHNSI